MIQSFYRSVLLPLFLVCVVVVMLLQIAATGSATALAIASAVGFIAPFVLKLVPLDGRYMEGVTALTSAVIAVVALLVSGEVSLSDLSAADPTKIYSTIVVTFGVTQAVFAYFKDHPLGPLAVK